MESRYRPLTTLDEEMRAKDDNLADATEALLLASRALIGVAARSLSDLNDITLPQYRALIVLSRPKPVTVGDLAEALDIHPSTATRLCDRLERKSLVRRRPGVSPDRRLTPVSLTAKGRRLVERITDHRRRDLAAIASSMDKDDLQHVIRALQSFAEVAGEMPAVDTFGWGDSARLDASAAG